MSRRHRAERRETLPDPKFGNIKITRFMNSIMRQGKKSVAESIVYGALDKIESKIKQNPLQSFEQALDNVSPSIEVRPERRQTLAIRWIIEAARDRNEKTMVDKLSAELLDASNNRGNAVKKREDTHRMAEANKAFAHYRW